MAHPAPPQDRLRIGRSSGTFGIHLVTTRCYAGRTIFSCLVCGFVVVDELRRLDALGSTATIAYAVMPDRLHWLFELRAGTLESAVAQVKGRAALRINRGRGSVGRIWQPGFRDYALPDGAAVRRCGEAVVLHPVRARLVERPQEYPLSHAAWWQDPQD